MTRARRLSALVSCVAVPLVVVSVSLATSGGGVSAASNRSHAQVEAARLLAMLQLPPGASGSASEPAGDHGVLAQPGYDEATPNLVDSYGWWTVRGRASDVLGYVIGRLPSTAKSFTSGFGDVAPGFRSESFRLAAIGNVLSERVLAVTVVQLTKSVTAVRTDGEAVWITPRPAWEQIPRGAQKVSFAASGATASGKAGPISAAQTLDGAKAIRLVDFINRLGVVQPGTRSCPAGRYGFVRLRFYGSNGETVARAIEQPSGCAFVSLKIGTRTGPALNDYPSVTGELERLNAIPVCSASQLQPSATLPSRNPGELSVSFEFRNESDSVCRLSGFPRLTLLNALHHVVPTTLSDQGAAIVRREGINAAVPLDPQQSASFGVSWTRCTATRAVSVTIRLPGIAHRFELAAGSDRRPFDPCHGHLKLGNLFGAP